MPSSPAEPITPDPPHPEPAAPQPAFRFRAWNLLLLVPLISLVTPLFDGREPQLAGLPFFYWIQMAVIPLGILCTLAVHVLTRHVDEEGETKQATQHADRGARPMEGDR